MLKRWFSGFAPLFLLVLAPSAQAADPRPAPPALVVRAQAIDELLADVQYLATLVGQEDQAKQLEGLLKSMVGPKGLEGIDTKRPIGLYGYLGAAGIDSTAIALVPVSDEKALLALLDRLNLKATRGDDDVYTVKADQVPVEVYFRFANGYAYITARDKAAIARDKLLAPAEILPPGQIGTLSLNLRIDQIPRQLREIGLGEFERRVKDSGPPKGNTETQRKLEQQVRDQLVARIASLFHDGGEVSLRVKLDRKAEQLTVDASLAAQPGTPLASALADLGQTQSLFAGVPSRDSAMLVLGHVKLPESMRKALDPAVDEALGKLLEHVSDPAPRGLLEKILKAAAPTLKAGEVDAVVDVRGPGANKLYTVVAGVKLQQGRALEQALRDALQQVPENDRSKVQLDAEKVGDVSVHRLDILKDGDKDARQALGEGPVYVAIRNDAALVAAGENALAALKAALAAQPAGSKLVQLELSVARLAPLLKDQPAAPRVAQEVFTASPGGDKLLLTVEGGKALQMHFEMKTPLIRFAARLDQEEKKGK